MKRIERDEHGDWIARDSKGREYPESGFRWRTRSAARCAADEADMMERAAVPATKSAQ